MLTLKSYGRSAPLNRIVCAFRDTAVTQARIHTRLEKCDLFPGEGDRPGDVFVPSLAGCLPVHATSRLRIVAPSNAACTQPEETHSFQAAACTTSLSAAPSPTLVTPALSCAIVEVTLQLRRRTPRTTRSWHSIRVRKCFPCAHACYE